MPFVACVLNTSFVSLFDLLVLLAGNAGRALGKQEIVDAIWSGRAISDSALTSRIKAARRAIGDNGREQRLLRTLHKIGYLFDTEVETSSGSAQGNASAPSAPSAETRFFRDRSGKRIAYSVAGEGPLVICPAWWVSNVGRDDEYAEVAGFFARLGQGVTLVRYDRPGVGMSDPDDEAVLFAVTSDCGHKGTLVAAYGPGAPASAPATAPGLPA